MQGIRNPKPCFIQRFAFPLKEGGGGGKRYLVVISTHETPNAHLFPYVYTPYLVLITMFPGK